MYNSNVKVKLNVSKALKDLNKQYHRNYTLQDVANEIGVSRETLSRLTSFSAFNIIYAVASCLYQYFPEYNDTYWNFEVYVMLLSLDDYSFIL